LKIQFAQICDRLDAIKNHPIYTLAEKALLATALLSILVGLAAHIILLTVAGSLGTGSYAGYKAYQYVSGENNTTVPRICFK
jgi:NADH:ubiquinone oxidoreductase subunit 3 (subunit A)